MLYLKEIKRSSKDTLFTFLKKCIAEKNFKVFGAFPTTYLDKECNQIEISPKYRSFESIVEISKTYFKVSEKKVAKTLKKIILENNVSGFLYCLAANKWIFYSNMDYFNEERHIFKYSDSHLKTHLKGSGKYTFNDIEKLMNS